MNLGYIFGRFFSYLFKLDTRVKNIYSLLASLPALGSLPLVLGKALCNEGGLLYGDPKCNDLLGFMVLDLTVFQIQLFFIGYAFILKDMEVYIPTQEKMHYL